MTPVELREMGEDANNDELERLAEKFRRQHLEEIKKAESGRFGRVYPIGRDDYTREVTEASKVTIPGDPGKGTGVVCLLYRDGSVSFHLGVISTSPSPRLPRSERTFEHIRALAQRHPKSKFVSIVGDKCIPDLPESRQPMLIIYRDGEVQNQIVAWGGDRERRLDGKSGHTGPWTEFASLMRVSQNWRPCWFYVVRLYPQAFLKLTGISETWTLEMSRRAGDRDRDMGQEVPHVGQRRRRRMKIQVRSWICKVHSSVINCRCPAIGLSSRLKRDGM